MMKKLLMLSVLTLIAGLGVCQNSIPLKDAPFFGVDVIISDHPEKDQCKVSITSAPNGWLYAMTLYFVNDLPALGIHKSTDGGINWTSLIEGSTFGDYNDIYLRSQIISAGTDIENLRLYFCYTLQDTIDNIFSTFLLRAKAEPFDVEELIHLPDLIEITSISLSRVPGSDWQNFSLLYSSNAYKDSLIFMSSTNGGLTFTRQQVSVTAKSFHNVNLAYGSKNSTDGKFFAVWENKENVIDQYGHIYTAMSNEFGSFTNPVCIDSINANFINKCRKPEICCNSSNYSNNFSDITELILMEFSENNVQHDIIGFFNVQPNNQTNFHPVSFTDNSHNNIEPSLVFNKADSMFYITWFDSTETKLNCVKQNFNIQTPNNWNTVIEGYNDEDSIYNPEPKVAINEAEGKPAFVWKKKNASGNNVGMFDAEYSTYNGLDEKSFDNDILVFPNPCSEKITFRMPANVDGKSDLQITNLNSQILIEKKIDPNQREIILKTEFLKSGFYILILRSNNNTYYGKFIKK